jgi:hypothetical protein
MELNYTRNEWGRCEITLETSVVFSFKKLDLSLVIAVRLRVVNLKF